MFDKEAILDLIRQMPDNATVEEVIAALFGAQTGRTIG